MHVLEAAVLVGSLEEHVSVLHDRHRASYSCSDAAGSSSSDADERQDRARLIFGRLLQKGARSKINLRPKR
eukprot:3760290-Prymnesium_polylepis.1